MSQPVTLQTMSCPGATVTDVVMSGPETGQLATAVTGTTACAPPAGIKARPKNVIDPIATAANFFIVFLSNTCCGGGVCVKTQLITYQQNCVGREQVGPSIGDHVRPYARRAVLPRRRHASGGPYVRCNLKHRKAIPEEIESVSIIIKLRVVEHSVEDFLRKLLQLFPDYSDLQFYEYFKKLEGRKKI